MQLSTILFAVAALVIIWTNATLPRPSAITLLSSGVSVPLPSNDSELEGIEDVLECFVPDEERLVAMQCQSLDRPWVFNYVAKLGIVTSLVAADERYLASFIEDVRLQTMRSCDLVLVSASVHILNVGRALLATGASHCHWTLLQLSHDPGLYETWDLVARLVKTELITNWNADDRKRPDALELKARELERRPEVAVVSSAVLANVGEEVGSWSQLSAKLEPTAWWTRLESHNWKDGPGWELGVCDFIKLDGSKRRALGTTNIPHNSPMWRRSIHDHPLIGSFSGGWDAPNGVAPHCSDWSLWVRVVMAGLKIWHITEPLEIYLARPSSHNRRARPKQRERCISFCMRVLEVQCMPPPGMSIATWKAVGRRPGINVSFTPCSKCAGPGPRCVVGGDPD